MYCMWDMKMSSEDEMRGCLIVCGCEAVTFYFFIFFPSSFHPPFRVETVIMELERTRRPVLIIGHRAVIRCLYSYLCEVPHEAMPVVDVPLHTVLKITPQAYGTSVKKFEIDIST